MNLDQIRLSRDSFVKLNSFPYNRTGSNETVFCLLFSLNQPTGPIQSLSRHFFVLWYWIDVSPAMVEMLISNEIVDGN